MKGIKCCGDCGYYNWKKHKCTRAVDEGNAQDHFYKDCPLPDAEPVVHGRWVNKNEEGIYGAAYCSVCDFELRIDDMPYCPMCGAKMDVEQGDS